MVSDPARMYQVIFERSPHSMVIVADDGTLLEANDAARALGVNPEVLLSLPGPSHLARGSSVEFERA